MKTKLMKFKKIAQVIALASLTLVMANCSNNGSNGNNNMGTQYVYSNGVCIDPRTNTQVQPTLCSTSTRYQFMNGQCYDSISRTYTVITLCQNQSPYGATGNGYSTCNGTYYYNQGNGVQTILCSPTSTTTYSASYQTGANMVYNCRGLYLYQYIAQQYQQVLCQ